MNEYDTIYLTTVYGPNNRIIYSMHHAATNDLEILEKNIKEFREYLLATGLIEGKDFY